MFVYQITYFKCLPVKWPTLNLYLSYDISLMFVYQKTYLKFVSIKWPILNVRLSSDLSLMFVYQLTWHKCLSIKRPTLNVCPTNELPWMFVYQMTTQMFVYQMYVFDEGKAFTGSPDFWFISIFNVHLHQYK